MYHSITFGTKNTWDDWHLIPTSRPLFSPPAVKTNQIDIPGGDGSIDLTCALTGRPTYSNRTGTFEFFVENGFREWYELYSEIMVYLQGQKMRAILEDDPTYYYEGRFSVNDWKSNKDRSTIVIDYNVGPYKKSILASEENWLWDTFSFENGVIRCYRDLVVDGTLTISMLVDVPEDILTVVTTASDMTLAFSGETYALVKGANYIPTTGLVEGENQLTFTGEGGVTIERTGGRL